jgi:2-polyprenyl-3-methyl-5-hydroxy-6-metoxy-1,4-benzoquinol methylase
MCKPASADLERLEAFLMEREDLKQFYEKDAARFWDPRRGMIGRDLHIYPLLDGLGGRVLEYGCGSGSLLLALAKEDRFTSLCGVDISESAISKVRQAAVDMEVGEKVSVLTPRDDRLPEVPDGSVDVILSLDTIEHVLDPYIVIDEFNRIASERAIFVISVPNYAYIKYVVQLFLGRQPVTGSDEPVERWRHAGWDGMHLHTFTKSSLEILLRDCGWEPKRWTGYGDRYKMLGLGFLRSRFPGFWSGALTAVCTKIPR